MNSEHPYLIPLLSSFVRTGWHKLHKCASCGCQKVWTKVLSPYINWNIRLDLFMIQIYSDIHLQKKSRMTHPVKWYITIMHITLNSQLHAQITDLSLSLSISKYAPYDFLWAFLCLTKGCQLLPACIRTLLETCLPAQTDMFSI